MTEKSFSGDRCLDSLLIAVSLKFENQKSRLTCRVKFDSMKADIRIIITLTKGQ